MARKFGFPLHNKSFTKNVVTLWYRPPEILLGSGNYDAACDVWAVDLLLFTSFFFTPVFFSRLFSSLPFSAFLNQGAAMMTVVLRLFFSLFALLLVVFSVDSCFLN
ncbi:cmgc cdk protein [Cystoisospora suis]|uniref:Cmgc cdk protein n=1 Tax=Cystoisospora suis TaxID=483139 RepID=A0A2C6KN03_9APIC|nr:cmgc cdk protein [Cystoisospora suis]